MTIRNKNAQRGFTLIELILTLGIFSMIALVAYPMLTFSYKTADHELKESNQRNEVRLLSDYLQNDIEYSKDLILMDHSTLRVINSKGETVNYYADRSGSESYIVRDNGTVSEFKNIEEIDFEILNEHLLQARLITDTDNNKFTDFKIFRWNMIIQKPDDEDDIHEYIVDNKVFVFVYQIDSSGGGTIIGPDATVIFNNGIDMNSGDFSVKNIYVGGNLSLGGNATVGKPDNTSSIFVSGDVSLKGSSILYGMPVTGGGFQFPDITMPALQSDSWYAERGYTSVNTPRDSMKYIGGDITLDNDAASVSIASSGNIYLEKSTVSGILFAPNGQVEIGAKSNFTGVIIAQKIYIKNDAQITFEQTGINELPF